MKISEVYAENLVMQTNSQQKSAKPENGRDFDSVFERRARVENTQKPEQDKKANVQRSNAEKQKPIKKTVAEGTEKPAEINNPEDVENQVNEISQTKDKPDGNFAETKEPEDKIIEEISVLTGIPAEDILQMLASLNITPVQLKEPEKLLDFVMTLKEVKTPAELLTKPEVPELISAIKEIVEKLPETSKAYLPVETQPEIVLKPETAVKVQQTVVMPQAQEELIQPEDDEAVDIHAGEAVAKTVEKAETTVTANSKPDFQRPQNGENPEIELDIMPASIMADVKTETVFHVQQARAQAVIANANPMEVITQIAEKISLSARADTTEMKMTLKPEALGEVTLKVTTQNGIVTAQFVAESQRVKEIIESNFNNLRDTLTKQGIEVSALSVSVSSDNTDTPQGRFNMERERSSSRISSILNRMDLSEEETVLPEAKLTETQVDLRI